ncbi:MAG: hypothetical protein H0X25_15150 [Acidobacteriales bacterium]|nr:hypothetical protein [Terriglobales bacterium]
MRAERRPSQLSKLIELFTTNKHRPVSLPTIRALGIAQHSARLNTLRKMGYDIQNHMDRKPDGEVRSFYVLRAEPGERPRQSAAVWLGSHVPDSHEPGLFPEAEASRYLYPD